MTTLELILITALVLITGTMLWLISQLDKADAELYWLKFDKNTMSTKYMDAVAIVKNQETDRQERQRMVQEILTEYSPMHWLIISPTKNSEGMDSGNVRIICLNCISEFEFSEEKLVIHTNTRTDYGIIAMPFYDQVRMINSEQVKHEIRARELRNQKQNEDCAERGRTIKEESR